MKYRAYPKYKDSSIKWIGSYPTKWKLTRVKFESYVKARVGWHGLKSDDFTDEGPYLVTGSDFKGPDIDWKECYHCDLERYDQDPYIQLKENDLLITKDGTIGKVVLVKNLDGKATLNSGVFVVRPLSDHYTSRFYFWLLQSSVFTGFVDFNKTGSTIVHLYQDTFVNFSYAMPSLIEQKQIAAFLDRETAKIDTLIEKQQQLIKLLKEKRQAVISHAVTKGLNPDVPMRDSGVEWLGEVPEHWKVSKLGLLAFMQEGPGLRTWQFKDYGTRVICVTNITEDGINFSKLEKFISKEEYMQSYQHFTVNRDDILLSRSGNSWGKVAKYEGDEKVILNTSTIRLNELKHQPLVSQYIQNFLTSEACREQLGIAMTGSCQPNFGPTHLNEVMTPIPPLSEQKQIAKFLDMKTTKIDKLISKAEQAIKLIKERRTALISAAVTGKIDVRHEVTL